MECVLSPCRRGFVSFFIFLLMCDTLCVFSLAFCAFVVYVCMLLLCCLCGVINDNNNESLAMTSDPLNDSYIAYR